MYKLTKLHNQRRSLKIPLTYCKTVLSRGDPCTSNPRWTDTRTKIAYVMEANKFNDTAI